MISELKRGIQNQCVLQLYLGHGFAFWGEFSYFKCHYYVKNLRGAVLGFEVSGMPIAYGTPNSQK